MVISCRLASKKEQSSHTQPQKFTNDKYSEQSIPFSCDAWTPAPAILGTTEGRQCFPSCGHYIEESYDQLHVSQEPQSPRWTQFLQEGTNASSVTDIWQDKDRFRSYVVILLWSDFSSERGYFLFRQHKTSQPHNVSLLEMWAALECCGYETWGKHLPQHLVTYYLSMCPQMLTNVLTIYCV